ncbi:MAG: hypothetical protein V1870_04445 [Candidatus Aenigmatarchaeota archaeon]
MRKMAPLVEKRSYNQTELERLGLKKTAENRVLASYSQGMTVPVKTKVSIEVVDVEIKYVFTRKDDGYLPYVVLYQRL